MIKVIKSNKTQFEYDIQAILKSFYPEWEPRMLAPDTEIRDRRILEGEPVMELIFGEDEVTLEMIRGFRQIEAEKPEGADGSSEFYVGLHNVEARSGSANDTDERIYIWQPQEASGTPEYKNAFKRFFYRCLCEETGTTLPWGI